MAWIFGGKHFGQYTYEHWFDDEYSDAKTNDAERSKTSNAEMKNDSEGSINPDDSTTPHKPPPQP
jgi:hypothetical protein